VLDTKTAATGSAFATEAGVTDPRAEVALTSRLAAANDNERMRFAVFPAVRGSETMLLSFSIDSSLVEIYFS
jgi:hypothetical protein